MRTVQTAAVQTTSSVEPALITSSKPSYLLSTDDSERERLYKQHLLLRKFAYNGRSTADPNYRLPRNARVLDSGTGSGSWLVDLAKEVPRSVQMYGIDPSTRLFPPSPPSNMRFASHSVMSLPVLWSNHFHFVNQRLLIGALRVQDWPQALAEIYRVLVPGEGRVQLGELSDWDGQTDAQQRHWRLTRTLYASSGHSELCAYKIPALLKAAGFVDVNVEIRKVNFGAWAGEDGEAGKLSIGGALRAMEGAFIQHGLVKDSEEYRQLVGAVEKDWDENVGSHFLFHVITARKPESN